MRMIQELLDRHDVSMTMIDTHVSNIGRSAIRSPRVFCPCRADVILVPRFFPGRRRRLHGSRRLCPGRSCWAPLGQNPPVELQGSGLLVAWAILLGPFGAKSTRRITGLRLLGCLLVLSAALLMFVIEWTDRAVSSFAHEMRDLLMSGCHQCRKERFDKDYRCAEHDYEFIPNGTDVLDCQ
jgi:hypothetical protein